MDGGRIVTFLRYSLDMHGRAVLKTDSILLLTDEDGMTMRNVQHAVRSHSWLRQVAQRTERGGGNGGHQALFRAAFAAPNGADGVGAPARLPS